MAKQANVNSVRIVGVKPTTIGTLQGTFFALIGLASVIFYTVGASANMTEATDSLFKGLTLGLARGIVAIIVVPLVYFAVGWIIGFFQGLVLNAVVSLSGGVVVDTVDE